MAIHDKNPERGDPARGECRYRIAPGYFKPMAISAETKNL